MLLLRCRLLGGLSFKRVFIDCNFVLSHHQNHNPANGEDTLMPRYRYLFISSSLHFLRAKAKDSGLITSRKLLDRKEPL